jgi:hypothetical protein
MSQRAINQKLLALALEYGVEGDNGKVILNRQGLSGLDQELMELHQAVQRAINKGGLVVVRKDDILITTYRLDSYRRRVGQDNGHKEAA